MVSFDLSWRLGQMLHHHIVQQYHELDAFGVVKLTNELNSMLMQSSTLANMQARQHGVENVTRTSKARQLSTVLWTTGGC